MFCFVSSLHHRHQYCAFIFRLLKLHFSGRRRWRRRKGHLSICCMPIMPEKKRRKKSVFAWTWYVEFIVILHQRAFQYKQSICQFGIARYASFGRQWTYFPLSDKYSAAWSFRSKSVMSKSGKSTFISVRQCWGKTAKEGPSTINSHARRQLGFLHIRVLIIYCKFPWLHAELQTASAWTNNEYKLTTLHIW